MSDVHEAFQKILDAKRSSLLESKLELETLRASLLKQQIDLDAWEQASKVAAGETGFLEKEVAASNLLPASSPIPDQRRGPRGVWLRLMPATLMQFGENPFRVAEVVEVAHSNGQSVSTATVRVQMSNYVKRGWLNRISLGVFEFTAEGKELFESIKNAPGETP